MRDGGVRKPKVLRSASALPKSVERLDTTAIAFNELFFIEHPELHKTDAHAQKEALAFAKKHADSAFWVHYAWRNLAVRIPSEPVYFRLRTARNRDLITDAEQKAYRAMTVGIAGLSVGSAVLASLVATGGPKNLKLADPDTIEITNLNRIRAALPDVGMNKTVVAARDAWELDPFLNLRMLKEGLTQRTLPNFIAGAPKLDVFIDEMDNIELKVLSRIECRKRRVPVVMATDNGDGVIVDVERFDLEPKRPLFHGRVTLPKDLRDLSREQFLRMASAIIDPSYFTPRQQESIMHIGKTLSGVAQLSTAATLSGAAAAYAVRLIGTGAELPSGRYAFGLEGVFTRGYHSKTQARKRAALTKKFVQKMSRR